MRWLRQVALAGVLVLSAGCGDTGLSAARDDAERLAESVGSQSEDRVGPADGQTAPQVEPPPLGGQRAEGSGVLALAALEPRSVVQFNVGDLRRDEAQGGLRPVSSSRAVGAVYQLLPGPDGGYLASTTDGADVLRLTRDLAVVSKQPLAQVLGGPASDVRIGALLVSGPGVIAVVATGTRVVLFRLDPRTLRVVGTASFPDRFAGYPPACLLASGELAVGATGFVDLYDSRTLGRVRTLRETDSGALSCSGDTVAIASADSPRVDLVSSTGAPRAVATYTGKPATGLLALRAGGWLVLDGLSGRAAVCSAAGSCGEPRSVGRKPNGAVELPDGTLVVSSEKGQSLHVLAAGLDRVRVYELGFSPRAPLLA